MPPEEPVELSVEEIQKKNKLRTIIEWLDEKAVLVQSFSSVILAFLTCGLVFYSFATLSQASKQYDLQLKTIDLQLKRFEAEHAPVVILLASQSKPFVKDDTFFLDWKIANSPERGYAENLLCASAGMVIEKSVDGNLSSELMFAASSVISLLESGTAKNMRTSTSDPEKVPLLSQAIDEEGTLVIVLTTKYNIPKLFTIDGIEKEETIISIFKWSKGYNHFVEADKKIYEYALQSYKQLLQDEKKD